jgi:hypothetical protein
MLDKEATTTINEELVKLKKSLLRYQQKVTATTLQIRKLEAAKHTKFLEFFDITQK